LDQNFAIGLETFYTSLLILLSMTVSVAAAQYPISKHVSFDQWAQHAERWVAAAAKPRVKLLLFPEYGAMELVSILPPEIQQDIRGQIRELDAIKDGFCAVYSSLAKKHEIMIVAPSIPILDENGRNVNRVHVFSKNGLVGYQDKFFMTRFEDETWGIESGKKDLTIFETSWGSFGVQICYDVEFGLGSHLLSAAGANLILAPSCTETIRGATRVHIGARARALENQLFSVVSQTIGNAYWSPAVDVNYGFAGFYATPDKNLPEEGIVATMEPQKEGWLIQELDFEKIEEVRRSGQVFNYRDQQRMKIAFQDEEVFIKHVKTDG
jgi:predicted amidohydrolase